LDNDAREGQAVREHVATSSPFNLALSPELVWVTI
jgi:hypothetical protein